MAVEEHGIATGHEECGYETRITLDRNLSIEETEVFGVNMAFPRFHSCAEVMEGDGFTIHLDTAPKYEPVEFIAFVSDQRESDICPALRGCWCMLPLGCAKLKYIVVDIEREGDIKIVRADRRMWALRFCSLEVEEAYLMPEKGSDVTLQWRKASRRAVA